MVLHDDKNSAKSTVFSADDMWINCRTGLLAKCTYSETSLIRLPLILLRRGAGWLMVSREGRSGTRQLAHSSSFWPVIGTYTSYMVG